MPAPKRMTVRQQEAHAKAMVADWNVKHPVGTMVSFEEVVGRGESHRGESTTEAQVIGGHSAVIWIEGKSGCVSLDHCTAVAAEPVAVPVLKITLGDHGQDFTEWYVRDGIVIDCQPNQGRVWVGTKVTNQATLCHHGIIAVISKATGEQTTLNYPIAEIETLSPEAAAEVEGYGRKWAEMMSMSHADLGL